MLLLCFDLPRYTPKEKKDAAKFRKHFISLGFSMKQFSLYERPIKRLETKEKILKDICLNIPEKGAITLYELPDNVNDNQVIILGNKAIKKSFKRPKLIVL